MRRFLLSTALIASGINADEDSRGPPALRNRNSEKNQKDPRFFCWFFGTCGAPATQAPTQAPTQPPTTKTTTTTTTPRPECALDTQMQYFQSTSFGWGNMVHGCTFSKIEDCMEACVNKKDCKGFSFDPPPAKYSNNCFLFSKVGSNWNENDPNFTSGFKCDDHPKPLPSKPPTVTSWEDWSPTSTPAPTQPPPPPPPTCNDKSLVLCKVYGDPHFNTLDGRFINNQGKGYRLLSQYMGRQLPKYKVVAYTKNLWWFNPWVSMVENVALNFEGQTKGHSWTFKFTLGPWNSVRSEIVHTFADGRRQRVSGNNEWNNGDFNYICMRGQACVTTYFGLKVCFASKKWYAQVYVPNCYKNKGIIGACGNFNGNSWDDGAVPGTSPIRLRRAIEPEQPEIVKRDADQDPSKIVEKAFDNSTPETRKATCNQDYDTVFAACDRVASEKPFAACYDTDATTSWMETCIFDACSENETDFCADYKTYTAGCADDNLGTIKKGDDYCNWAEQTGCVPECGENSHWEGCVDECNDIKTCGSRSPVPKDCPTDVKMVSMCVCNDGYVMMDDKCVPESECGCTTEEGATIPLNSEHKSCEEVCTCGSDRSYTCVSLDPSDPAFPDECKSTEEAQKEAEDDLESIMDEVETKSGKLSSKFKRHSVGRLNNIKKRALRLQKHNRCEGQSRRRRSTKSAKKGDCPRLLELVDEFDQWIDDNLDNCEKETDKAAFFKTATNRVRTKLNKKCDKNHSD